MGIDKALGHYLTELKWEEYFSTLGLEKIFPYHLNQLFPNPDLFYTSAGSTLAAAAMGGIYGLFGRAIYPNSGVFPLHYSVWFAVAYQIKRNIQHFEDYFGFFVEVEEYLDNLGKVPDQGWNLNNQLRYRCWKLVQKKNACLNAIDRVFSNLFNLRMHQEITSANVYDSSFLEMCRYRIWSVFKTTMINMASFSLAYRLSNAMAFFLPSQTTIPLLVVIQSIFQEIVLIPALYIHLRVGHQLVDGWLVNEKVKEICRRFSWIRHCLPPL